MQILDVWFGQPKVLSRKDSACLEVKRKYGNGVINLKLSIFGQQLLSIWIESRPQLEHEGTLTFNYSSQMKKKLKNPKSWEENEKNLMSLRQREKNI